MIDDAVLEDLFRSIGETLDVPPDGPDAVLAAARGSRSGHPVGSVAGPAGPRIRAAAPISTWSKRRLVTVAAVAAVVVLIAGAGADALAGSEGTSHPTAARSITPAAPASKAAASGAGSGSGAVVPALHQSDLNGVKPGASTGSSYGASVPASAATPPASSGSSSGLSPNEVPTAQSEVIKTGSLSLVVARGTVSSVMTSLTDAAAADGGFVATSSTDTTTNNGSTPSGNITLRVPVAKFESLLGSVEKLGTPTSVTTSGQDVTSQYVDLQARIQSLEDARTQFQQILAQARSIGDILAVEQQISDLQTQIEQLQGQLQVMTNQATYSTLTVQVSEMAKKAVVVPPPRPPRPPSGISKAWAHARHSFAHGFEAVVGATGGFAVFLILAGALALALRLGWVFLRRRLV